MKNLIDVYVAGQRSKHEGTFRKRTKLLKSGKVLTYFEGVIQINNKKYYATGATLREAKAKIREISANGGKETRFDDKTSLEKYTKYWLEQTVKVAKKESTYNNYKYIAESFIYPILGDMQLKKITRPVVQEFIRCFNNNDDEKSKLSPRTIQLIKIVLGAVFHSAEKEELIIKSPVYDIILPKREKKTPVILSHAEIKKLMAIDTRKDTLCTLCKMIMFTGLRRGEAIPLTWEDVDFTNKTLLVNKAASLVNNKIVLSTPKNNTSFRIVPFPDNVNKLLLDWKASQKAHKSDLLFYSDKNTDTGILHPDSVRKGLKRLLATAGIKKEVTVHGLRHSYATMLLEMEVQLKIVQELLGHADISTTGNIYSHVNLSMKNSAMSKLNSHG